MAVMRSLHKRFVLQLGVTIGVVFFLIVLHIFLNFDIGRRNENIRSIFSDLLFSQQARQSFVILADEAKKAGAYGEFLEKVLPPSDELIHFNQALRDLAAKYESKVSFVFGDETLGSENDPGYTNFNITIDSPVSSFSDFLDAFNTLSYVIFFDSIEYSRFDGNVVRAQISGKVFTQ